MKRLPRRKRLRAKGLPKPCAGAMRGSKWVDSGPVAPLRPGEFFQCTRCHARTNNPSLFRVAGLRRADLELHKKYQGKCSRCPSHEVTFEYDPAAPKGSIPHVKGDQRLQYPRAMPTCKSCGKMSKHHHVLGPRVQDVKFCCGRPACCKRIIKNPASLPMSLPSLF